METQPVKAKQGDAIRPVAKVTLDDVVVEAFLDTGSDVSIIAEDVFRRIDPKHKERRPFDKKLVYFTSERSQF